ncbi:hypothetical protein YC2023_037350 [Brassica napus]
MIAAPSAPFITSVAQTQSRNAFYSALKKKTSTNISTSSCIFPSVEEKSDISKELVASNPSSVHAAERDGGFEPADLPDEEEAEFLKSLGWDENNTEVEALTDEEIRAFYEQVYEHNNTPTPHKKLKPSLMKKLPIIKEATEDATLSS